MPRRYEFYFRVVKTIFYERAQRVFLTRENKIHIFKPPCNLLFYYIDKSIPLHFFTDCLDCRAWSSRCAGLVFVLFHDSWDGWVG